LYIGCSTCRKN